jgi:hypothetical protein
LFRQATPGFDLENSPNAEVPANAYEDKSTIDYFSLPDKKFPPLFGRTASGGVKGHFSNVNDVLKVATGKGVN